jgi:hypothetical protein
MLKTSLGNLRVSRTMNKNQECTNRALTRTFGTSRIKLLRSRPTLDWTPIEICYDELRRYCGTPDFSILSSHGHKSESFERIQKQHLAPWSTNSDVSGSTNQSNSVIATALLSQRSEPI